MKSSRKPAKKLRVAIALAFATVAGLIALSARGDFPEWLQNVESGTPLENALFRWMDLPAGKVLLRRPPQESRALLDDMVKAQPGDADLLSLRAMSEEQQLDFDSAEKDWKAYAQSASDREFAGIALADFYHRRARPVDEIAALSAVTALPERPSEKLLAPEQQECWFVFERIFRVIAANALPPELSDAQYRARIARYPREASVYTRYFEFLLDERNYSAAQTFIETYAKAFPGDAVFPVKARALLDYRKGDIAQGLADYDKSFEPLWPPELIQGYFSLLQQTDNLRKFLDASRAARSANPDDLNATARIFYYYQQEGKPAAAQEAIDEFRAHKESAQAAWKSEELFTLAQLLEQIQAYPEAARYYAALYGNGQGDAAENRERALTGLTHILLASPDQPLRLGAGNLSLYKDIGAADPGPGFLNGILSLLFNSQDPKASFADEEQRGVAYFHRAEAAKLLAMLDAQFPNARERAALHVRLLQVYAEYGESDVVIRRGKEFLAAFPDSPDRTNVSLQMADAYARLGDTENEFAIYDEALRELGQRAQNVPLGISADARRPPEPNEQGEASGQGADQSNEAAQRQPTPQAFQVAQGKTAALSGPRSAEYSDLLERYLSRLAALKQTPRALEVLRREVDRNPNDPGLYERLAQFLDQNKLGAQEEEVYQRAIQQFPDRSWYHKLARAYLRHRRTQEFEQLTGAVTKIFAGSDLESYFGDVVARYGGIDAQMYLRLNLYANQRFPHDLVFVRNLMMAYHARGTYNDAAFRELLREHWFEDSGLRAEYFEWLSESHQLDSELAALRTANPDLQAGHWQQAAQANPGALEFLAEATLWQSHFEDAAQPLGALEQEYPSDSDLGRRASSLYRSLAYFNPQNTEAAVGIEKNLLQSDPGNRDTLARIGDIYADRELFEQAAPYWNRMAEIEPGNSDSYLQPATVFWDYYKFDDALRLLNQGRAQLRRPAEFAYQEGAIYENEREYSRAIDEYVKGALAEGENSESYNRLMELARRPKLKSVVDRATDHLAGAQDSNLAVLRLRVKVLEAQDRKAEIRSLLLDEVGRAKSLEYAEGIEALAQQESLEDVRQSALEQQAKLTADPIRRLELRYSLVQFFENKKDFASAQKNIETLYHENPKVLGVIRATADFYWSRKMRQEAIDVLLQAAKDSYPELRDKFDYEAARKATEAGNCALARRLLDPLLQKSPYGGELLAAMADTYAKSGDSAGLRDFYLAKIALFRQASLPADDRARRIAELRRGLIPALTQLKDFSGAADQYIEILNQFPEDTGLTTEAALYAQDHALESRLTDFYAKTAAGSPRDYRWPMVLARLQTQFEDYPGAIASYTKSIGVRPDRADLYLARADLLERLMKFDEAVADYTKLYALSYHDPKYMLQVAELRARQGNPSGAIEALKTAYIDGHPNDAQNFFDAAHSLESWGLLSQAADFAQQGVDAAGDDLLANSANHDGAQLYVRVLTRLRRQKEAYARLDSAFAAARAPVNSLSSTVEQVEKRGLAAVSDSSWREREHQLRSAAGVNGMDSCLKEMGKAVAQYFTPEEKVAFAEFLAGKNDRDGVPTDYLIDAAEAAGLADLEARWHYEALLAAPSNPAGHLQRLIQLQSQRLKFAELAAGLEKYADLVSHESRSYVLLSAANAYRSAGDDANELRIYTELDRSAALFQNQQRYLELLFTRNRERLVELAGVPGGPWAEAATNFAIASGDHQLAYDTIRAHGATISPVWTNAYAALAGLYFADPASDIGKSFSRILDDRTIGERLHSKFDATEELSGNDWFYYGSRFGEYRGVTQTGDPEDFLPAILEQSPGTAAGYQITAEYYADAKDYARSVGDYESSLELEPDQAGIRDRLAMLYEMQGQPARAVAEWKKAFATLNKQEQRVSVPESFYVDFEFIAAHLKKEKLADTFKPDMDSLLRAYIRHNGVYNTLPLLHAAYLSLGDSAANVSWMLDLAAAAPDEDSLLAQLESVNWIPISRREPLYRGRLELAQARADKLEGEQKEAASGELQALQFGWLDYLITTRQYQRAKDSLDAIPADVRTQSTPEFAPYELRVAAGLNAIDSLIAAYRSDPEKAPSFETLQSVASDLEKEGNKPAARKILEFAYSRELERHNLAATNFLGLAEIRLEAGDTRGALELLDRLVLVVGAPFENLGSAAALLEKTGHSAEAAIYLEQLSRATPWDPAYRLRLARAQISTSKDAAGARRSLLAIAASGDVSYDLRISAAEALAGHAPEANPGSEELELLASGKQIAPQAANRPYFARARLAAASQNLPARDRIALLRAALEDAPYYESARIELIHAAAAAREYQLAYSAAQPLQTSGIFAPVENQQQDSDALQGFNDSQENEGSESASDDTAVDNEQPANNGSVDQNARPDDSSDQDEAHADVPISGELAHSNPERLRLGLDLAIVSENLDRLDDAARYLQFAESLESNRAPRARINARLNRLRAEIKLRAANAARRPVVHRELEQDRLVRPQLSQKSATPPAPKPAAPASQPSAPAHLSPARFLAFNQRSRP